MFPLFIVLRVLFVASMVFIIGHIFGNFSQRRTLAVFSKIAAILVIVLFFASTALGLRMGGSRAYDHYRGHHYYEHCDRWAEDSTLHK
jgi:high-affinity K+ transport system ATPase subunit B